MTISKKGVANGDTLELIKLSYAINPIKLQNEFNKLGIQINSENDLKGLADIVNKGLDKSGALKDGDKVIMFDTMRIIDGIKYDQSEIDKLQNNKNLFVE